MGQISLPMSLWFEKWTACAIPASPQLPLGPFLVKLFSSPVDRTGNNRVEHRTNSTGSRLILSYIDCTWLSHFLTLNLVALWPNAALVWLSFQQLTRSRGEKVPVSLLSIQVTSMKHGERRARAQGHRVKRHVLRPSYHLSLCNPLASSKCHAIHHRVTLTLHFSLTASLITHSLMPGVQKYFHQITNENHCEIRYTFFPLPDLAWFNQWR